MGLFQIESTYRVSQKHVVLWNSHNYLQTQPKSKDGGVWKLLDICYHMGTEIFKIEEEMTEKNEAEDGNSISLKSPWHMK